MPENSDSSHTFTRKKVENLLMRPVFLSPLRSIYNSCVVWDRKREPLSLLLDCRYMERLRQEGDPEKIYRGEQAGRMMLNDLRPDVGYYIVKSGFPDSAGKTLSIELGMTRSGEKSSTEGEEGPSSSEVWSLKQVETHSAIFIHLKRLDTSNDVSVTVDLEGLGLSSPEKEKEIEVTLQKIGYIMTSIGNGETPNFENLRRGLVEGVDLNMLGDIKPELEEASIPASRGLGASSPLAFKQRQAI